MQTEILISPAPTSSTFFSFWWRYLQNCRADVHQIFQKDGKLTAIEKLSFWFLNSFGGGRRFKRSLRLQTKLHKMQHGGKVDLLTEKRKPSDFGWTISQQNAENRARKSVNGRPRWFGTFYVAMHVGLYTGGSRWVAQWRIQDPREMASGAPRTNTNCANTKTEALDSRTTMPSGSVKPGTHRRQSWIQQGRLYWKSTVAETGNKVDCRRIRSTSLPIRSTLLLVLATNRQQLELDSLLRSTLLPIRSTWSPVCTGLKQHRHGLLYRLSTKSTVLNPTLSPVCTGL